MAALPGGAQSANFGSLTLSAEKTAGTLTGTTGGSTSLPAIVTERDRNNNQCLGFADPKPDHILTLQQDLPRLKLQVSSGGTDTTIVVQSAKGEVWCGDDSGARPDASIDDTNWQAGSYKIWVGSKTPGVRRDYTLRVR
ncbi:MAG TPA: hypothetical protein V6D18_00595 [Thermosynechococcaceae cyanobacterium]